MKTLKAFKILALFINVLWLNQVGGGGLTVAESDRMLEQHPLYIRMGKINPYLDDQYKKKVLVAIYSSANRHSVAVNKLYGILAQECRFRLKCVNRASNDFGIGQINERTVEAFGFDIDRLMTDLEYSVEAAAIVLADFKRMYWKREGDRYWTRYNSGRPSKREAYRVLVARFM